MEQIHNMHLPALRLYAFLFSCTSKTKTAMKLILYFINAKAIMETVHPKFVTFF